MKNSTLDPKNLGLATGIILGASFLALGIIATTTGLWTETVMTIGKLYPGYAPTPLGTVLGGIFGFLDGFIGAWLIAWLYNKFQKA